LGSKWVETWKDELYFYRIHKTNELCFMILFYLLRRQMLWWNQAVSHN
jgi:hypothetical protein